jgi:hypothetical protein
VIHPRKEFEVCQVLQLTEGQKLRGCFLVEEEIITRRGLRYESLAFHSIKISRAGTSKSPIYPGFYSKLASGKYVNYRCRTEMNGGEILADLEFMRESITCPRARDRRPVSP